MEKFYIDSYLKLNNKSTVNNNNKAVNFLKLCHKVNESFLREWEEGRESVESALTIQKKAIIGYEKEVAYFLSRIREYIIKHGYEATPYPDWYTSLEDGIYHEIWGMAGIAEWFSPQYINSSSAKIIGDRIYYLADGQMKLMPQKISKERREQLIRAFLLLTPEERLDKDFHEIYLLDGTRVTIFGGAMSKKGQDSIILRRYIIPTYDFEEQARRGTIPKEAISLFSSMASVGFNVAFTGAVRSAKTTFLSTWQSYEDGNLEGVMVETDPEIPLHKLMPEAPILQLIADNDKMKTISKNLLRSDADYFILAEARDGVALDTAIRIASKGTKRMKITFHTREPLDFPYDVASEIVKSVGGDLDATAKKVASSFDYIFHFVQLKTKNKKRLKSIHEMTFYRLTGRFSLKQICSYYYKNDCWTWSYIMSKDKHVLGEEENPEKFQLFIKELEKLSIC
jgi:pilus assembly protein CpaF